MTDTQKKPTNPLTPITRITPDTACVKMGYRRRYQSRRTSVTTGRTLEKSSVTGAPRVAH